MPQYARNATGNAGYVQHDDGPDRATYSNNRGNLISDKLHRPQPKDNPDSIGRHSMP